MEPNSNLNTGYWYQNYNLNFNQMYQQEMLSEDSNT
jgi:hypothetical protein